MSETRVGVISWIDLTVKDAASVARFYEQVAGWKTVPLHMDGYSDFSMQPPHGKEPVAGVCHARGENLGLPEQWLIYITVADLQDSLRICRENGGQVIREIMPLGEGRFAVIRDPAGAVCALYQVDN